MPGEKQKRHCDSYIMDYNAPMLLRRWLHHQRLPAVEKPILDGLIPETIFATWKGKRVELTMASRFGDVGIRFVGTKAPAHVCYEERGVPVEELSEFSETPEKP